MPYCSSHHLNGKIPGVAAWQPGSLYTRASVHHVTALCLDTNDVNVVHILLHFRSSQWSSPSPHWLFLLLLPSPKVKYKSDLNLTRGVGWTPPGSYKVEMARRAAELANRRGLGLQGAYVSNKQQTSPCLVRPREIQTHCCFSKFIFGQRSASSKEA